jgi:hypothetical protein
MPCLFLSCCDGVWRHLWRSSAQLAPQHHACRRPRFPNRTDCPCFAVADDAETRAGVRLYSLVVSERESEDSQSLPAKLWRFIVTPPGDWIDTTPQRCIRYGEPPPSAAPQSAAKPLVPDRVYVAFLGARPNAAAVPVVGYRAEFCLMRGSDGKSGVLVVPWDQGAKRWRYEVCTAR